MDSTRPDLSPLTDWHFFFFGDFLGWEQDWVDSGPKRKSALLKRKGILELKNWRHGSTTSAQASLFAVAIRYCFSFPSSSSSKSSSVSRFSNNNKTTITNTKRRHHDPFCRQRLGHRDCGCILSHRLTSAFLSNRGRRILSSSSSC